MTTTSDQQPEPNGAGPDGAEPIAVVGLSCRVPGAGDVAAYWHNLLHGVESIRRTDLDEQRAAGVAADDLADPNFVPVIAVYDGYQEFDPGVFGLSRRETELRDPQHRLFLELAYTALDDAGYGTASPEHETGVYAAVGEDAYQWRHIRRNAAALTTAGGIGIAVSSHPDYVATLASYHLNLRGPSLTVHTACSSSLVAVHLACEALRNGECGMAIAGAANLDLPAGHGYIYEEGGVTSPDGHCRAFDAQAAGTVWSGGGAVVVLKRLSDAIADGDTIRAVIRGNAVNNDGSSKVGFTAPSQSGQAAVIAEALGVAGIDARTIEYVEAHGTGTILGDPIEVAALTDVYRVASGDVGWCAIGSVKTNIGHLGPASGVAGLVKAVLALQNGVVPATLHYTEPNPYIDFADSPFYVNAAPIAWRSPSPRRAAVSSFGMGGTNAHLVLEEAPPATPADPAAPDRLDIIQLSAQTGTALAAMATRLAATLTGPDAPALRDVADTLRLGRRELPERLAVVAANTGDLVTALRTPRRRISGTAARPAQIALLFPGQGSTYPGMGSQLDRTDTRFRRAVDDCDSILHELTGLSVRDLLNPDNGHLLDDTLHAQPVLFTVEYAMAQLLRERGVTAAAFLGHSLGEYVAAVAGGVLTLTDALRLVVARAQLMQRLPEGAMLAVQAPAADLAAYLDEDCSIAAVNGPKSSVVSGPVDAIERITATLAAARVPARRLRTNRAFHSPMMDPILAEFQAAVQTVTARPAHTPILSNVTGRWLTAADATNPGYWIRHLRDTVRFGPAVAELLDGAWLLVEAGPGRQLSSLAKQQNHRITSVTTMPETGPDDEASTILGAVARLWTTGNLTPPAAGPAHRIPLPTYPWERTVHWIDPDPQSAAPDRQPAPATTRRSTDDWYALPVWQQLTPARPAARTRPDVLVLAATADLPAALRAAGLHVTVATPGPGFETTGDGGYRIRPDSTDDLDVLIDRVAPTWVIHAFAATGTPAADRAAVDAAQNHGFYSALALVSALAARATGDDVHLDIVTAGTQDVLGGDLTRPEHATVASIATVAPAELPWLSARHIDIAAEGPDGTRFGGLVDELLSEPDHPTVALRSARRWWQTFHDVAAPATGTGPGLRDEGVYVITGGTGGIGLSIAEHLARAHRARIVLVSRGGADDPATLRGARLEHSIAVMRGFGADVLVVAADVTDAAAMRRLRDRVIDEFGTVHGIVHAAGIAGGGVIELKQRVVAEQVLHSKVHGTLALRDAFGDLPLDFTVLCSSVTAVTGGFGQVDYCAANAFLDAHARSEHGWAGPVVSINWGRWLDVGMAVETVSPLRSAEQARAMTATPVVHPLLTSRRADIDADGGPVITVRGHLDPASQWILDDHRVDRVPVLAGTGQVEAVRAAFESATIRPTDQHRVQLRDVVFAEPVAVPDGTTDDLVITLTAQPGHTDQDFEVGLSSQPGRVLTHGVVGWSTAAPDRDALAEIRRRCRTSEPVDDQVTSTSGLLSFGPHWGNLRHLFRGDAESVAYLELTETVDGWTVHPALMDEATAYDSPADSIPRLPFGYGQITVHAPMPDRIWSHCRPRTTTIPDAVAFDITVYAPDGTVVLDVADFTLRTITPRPPVALDVRRTDPPGAASTARGIRPIEGAEAFARLVAGPLGPQVLVTEIPLLAASEPPAARTIGGDSVEPGRSGDLTDTDVLTKAVRDLWQELLGIDDIRPDDDFFEIGGNSLVAVQLISYVRREFRVRLPMRLLFADPTINGIAAAITALTGTSDPEPGE